ncbi:branched-chain amino acid ABC transporter periplasmic amino acid-binding protein [Bordetella trematum]|nr:branched-chain amino acid ABC transporter periplasmic amino acid-binding protein [Bordetella trematum]
MKRLNLKLAAAVLAASGAMGAIATPAMAAEEQFVPLMVYRTGSFAPWAFHGPTASSTI